MRVPQNLGSMAFSPPLILSLSKGGEEPAPAKAGVPEGRMRGAISQH